jgi:glucokinase
MLPALQKWRAARKARPGQAMDTRPLMLAADVGGTNRRLALFRGAEIVDEAHSHTAEGDFLGAALVFLAGRRPEVAGVAVAGPIRDGRARLTNQGEPYEAAAMARALRCPVALVNDFHAAALGISELDPGGYVRLAGPAPDAGGPAVVLGPGTGLGQALLAPAPGGRVVLPSEGGHTDLAPGDSDERRLVAWLSDRCAESDGHVSWERALSGPGLLDLHAFHRPPGAPVLTHPSQVTAGDDPASRAAVGMFCRLLGAMAGNAGLSLLATGGVWIAGGIAPRLRDRLADEGLVERFLAKGRFRSLMEGFPLLLVIDGRLGLRGAIAAARAQSLRAR